MLKKNQSVYDIDYVKHMTTNKQLQNSIRVGVCVLCVCSSFSSYFANLINIIRNNFMEINVAEGCVVK